MFNFVVFDDLLSCMFVL